METTIIAKQRMILMRLSGEIDHHAAIRIRDKLEREIKRSGAVNIALDFGCVSFMDSSGIGMIIGRYKTVKALGGELVVFGADEQIKRLMEMSGLGSLIVICDTLGQGLSKLNKSRGVKI